MKKSILIVLLSTIFTQQVLAADFLLAPVRLLVQASSNDYFSPELASTTNATIELINGNPGEALLGILLFPFAILNQETGEHRPSETMETLLAKGYSQTEIEQFSVDQKKIFDVLGGKKVTVHQFRATIDSLNLAASSREIMGLSN